MPRNLANVKSKIKGHIAYFKEMSRGRSNQPLFNKEPQVYYKEHPGDMGYDHEPTPHDNSRKVKQASLRNRSPLAQRSRHARGPSQGRSYAQDDMQVVSG